MKCSICGKDLKGYTNNASPANSGECCDDCNQKVVIPYRLFLNSTVRKDTALLVTPTKLKLIKPKGKYFTLEELQDAVGGYIELTDCIITDCLAVVNEEGLLMGLPFNTLANALFKLQIVGNVLIVPKLIFEEPEDDEE